MKNRYYNKKVIRLLAELTNFIGEFNNYMDTKLNRLIFFINYNYEIKFQINICGVLKPIMDTLSTAFFVHIASKCIRFKTFWISKWR